MEVEEEISQGQADAEMTVLAPPASSRLPLPPAMRGPLQWHVSSQAAKGRHASCQVCCSRFEDDELRLAKASDVRNNKSLYVHLHCLPGGFHAQDTFGGPAADSDQLRTAMGASMTPQPLNVAAPAPLDSMPHGLQCMSGDEWWLGWKRDNAYKVTTYPMIEVSAACLMAYASPH